MLNNFKNKLTQNPRISNFLWGIKGLWGDDKQKSNERFFLKKTKHMIPEYIKNHAVKKLNIGSQDHPFEGWLNVDIFAFDDVAYMNATKKFPIEDNTFDYIYTEHMIEHVTYDEGDFMLKECYRILKKGGKIRIVTPGLDKLLALRNEPVNDTFNKYINNLVQATHKTKIPSHIDYVINYITYNFLHRFIHSTYTLTQLLTNNGFDKIKNYEMYKSDDPNLCNLEIHAKWVGEDLYNFESIYIEAEK